MMVVTVRLQSPIRVAMCSTAALVRVVTGPIIVIRRVDISTSATFVPGRRHGAKIKVQHKMGVALGRRHGAKDKA